MFFCDECKDISLSHVMLAIKCHNDSTNAVLNELKQSSKKILIQLAKFDEVVKTNDDLINTMEGATELNKSKFKSIEKQLTALSDLILKKPRDVLTKSQLNSKLTRFTVPLTTLSTQIAALLVFLRETMHEEFHGINKTMSSQSATIRSLAVESAVQSVQLEEAKLSLSSLRDESASTKFTVMDIAEEMKTASSKYDLNPL